jgi:uroporphyrinogen decarboxylase
MTGKERFIAALSHAEPDRPASMEIEFQIYESYIGKPLIVGHAFDALSAKEKAIALEKNADRMVETAEKAGLDVIRPVGGYWEVAPGVPAMLWLRDRADQLTLLQAVKRRAGNRFFVLGTAGAGLGIPDGLHLRECVDSLYDEPEAMHAALNAAADDGVAWSFRQFDAGADGIINCVDVAFNTGTFFSPRQMDEFHFPYFNRWVDGVRGAGKWAIWHSDGNLNAILDRVLDSGVHALQCVDPMAGMDIVALHERFRGRLALIGNIDCALLQHGPVERIRAEARRLIDGCRGGGFAIGCCNAVYPEIPAEHYQVMVDEKMRGYGAS